MDRWARWSDRENLHPIPVICSDAGSTPLARLDGMMNSVSGLRFLERLVRAGSVG